MVRTTLHLSHSLSIFTANAFLLLSVLFVPVLSRAADTSPDVIEGENGQRPIALDETSELPKWTDDGDLAAEENDGPIDDEDDVPIEDDDDFTYEAEVRANPIEAPLVQETPGFAVAIETSDAAQHLTDVAELIDQTVGVSTRTLGGLGSFATLSIRGSAANQVLVLLDGIPLIGSTFSQVDVNLLPPDLLERIEVYRSGVPVWLGNAPMGGAINLVTRDSRQAFLTLSGSLGSYLTRKISALSAFRGSEAWSILAGFNYLGSEGDFPFYDDRGTPYNLQDDREIERKNNAFSLASALCRVGFEPSESVELSLQESFFFRHQGVPGLGQNQSEHAMLEGYRTVTHWGLTTLGWPSSLTDLFVTLHADLQEVHFVDRQGEIGLGNQDTLSQLDQFGGLVRMAVYPLEFLDLTTATELRYETYQSQSHLHSASSPADAHRLVFAPSLQTDMGFFDRRLVATVGGRLESSDSSFSGEMPFAYSTAAPPPQRADLLWTGQAGARLTLGPSWLAVTLRANMGRYERLPTFLEMYGATGSVIGNGDLQPETALGGDAGLGLGFSLEQVQGGIEVASFQYWYGDLIQFVQNAQRVARPENVSAAEISGIEVSARLGLSQWMALSSNYTFTFARDTSDISGQSGNQLPGRPRHSFSGRLTGRYAGIEATYSLHVDSGNVLDRANFKVVPDRVLHGLRLRYQPTWLFGWMFTIEANNLLDHRVEQVPLLPQPSGVEITTTQPVSDFIGFPLPGRTLYATVQWELP